MANNRDYLQLIIPPLGLFKSGVTLVSTKKYSIGSFSQVLLEAWKTVPWNIDTYVALVLYADMFRKELNFKGPKNLNHPLGGPGKCLKHKLHRKWKISLNRTSQILTKHFRKYHQETMYIFGSKINKLEAWLKMYDNFAEELDKIKRNTQRMATIQDKRK